MEKVATFLDKNKTWFSWGTVITMLGAAIWLIQAMNSLTNTINIINVNLDNFTRTYDARAVYVDSRLNDFEVRMRQCENRN